MSKINDAMCLTITPNDKGFIILEYVTPCPKNTIKDWDKYIRRQRVAGKPQIMLITTADKYYNDVLKFKHGDKFLIENKRVMLNPVREFQIPAGKYDITVFNKTR
ncbi:MAG: hypothetical protein IJS34_01480 [Alphaproteobacteria bacterium]|nr:hypothetical protein [Alphaproteobacteria bacterium]